MGILGDVAIVIVVVVVDVAAKWLLFDSFVSEIISACSCQTAMPLHLPNYCLLHLDPDNCEWKVNPHAADCRVKRGAPLKREHSD